MTNWSFPPDIQAQYDRVVADVRRLQKELGIEPRTLEQRHQDYIRRKAEQQRHKEELDRVRAIAGQRRPLPKWKV